MAPKRHTQVRLLLICSARHLGAHCLYLQMMSTQTLTKEKTDSSNFPPELDLEILEYVNCSDFESLFNCCLVSRAWRQLAQPFVSNC